MQNKAMIEFGSCHLPQPYALPNKKNPQTLAIIILAIMQL